MATQNKTFKRLKNKHSYWPIVTVSYPSHFLAVINTQQFNIKSSAELK